MTPHLMHNTEIEKTTKRLRKSVWQALDRYQMISKGDKVMVCLSGGKDSYTLLDILLHVQLVRKHAFDIIAVNLDQKQPGFPEDVLPTYLKERNVPFSIIEKDTYSVVKAKIPEGKTYCSLCSRLRRGNLYTAATELGATKIALGHHREDILETFFLNLFFSGKLEAMPAKYRTDNGEHTIIRPLAFCREDDIAAYARHQQFPIIPCTLCGSQPNMQRGIIKKMIKSWEQEYPNRPEVMMNALQNVSPSHLLDTDLFDFQQLMQKEQPSGTPLEEDALW